MDNRYKKSRLIVVTSLLLLLSGSLLFMTRNHATILGQFGKQVNTILTSVDGIFAKPTQFFSAQKDGLGALLSAYRENQELKRTIVQLESQLLEKETLLAENASLRENMGLQSSYSEKNFLPSLVTVRTPVSWMQQMTIGIGVDHAVQEGQLVLANGGLVGVVETVEEKTARVKLLTNADEFTKIPVKITMGDRAVYGILSGYDSDQHAFIVTQLNSVDEITVGSQVVTSDLAGDTSSNVLVGKVLSVNQKKGSFDRELFIQPAADFSSIYSVFVVGG